MEEHETPTILINKEAHIYLQRIQRKERGCKPLTKEQEDLLWERLSKYANTDLRLVDNLTYGGGDGSYNGRWWIWSIEDIKKMLSDAGFTWIDSDSRKYFLM